MSSRIAPLRKPRADLPPAAPLRIRSLLRQVYEAWDRDRVPRLAASLAFYTSFSLAPTLIIAIALAGLVFGPSAARGRVTQEIAGLVGPHAARSIEFVLRSAWESKANLWAGLVGTGVLLM